MLVDPVGLQSRENSPPEVKAVELEEMVPIQPVFKELLEILKSEPVEEVVDMSNLYVGVVVTMPTLTAPSKELVLLLGSKK